MPLQAVHFLVLAVELGPVHEDRTCEDCGHGWKEHNLFLLLLMLQIFLEPDVFFDDLGVIIELAGHLQHCQLDLLYLLLLSLQLHLPSLS